MMRLPWPDPVVLRPEEVHLWWVEAAPENGPSAEWLAEEERARSLRFHRERDRRRYVARQSALRGILGVYLDREPGALRFADGPHGKPFLAMSDSDGLCFNLSHSEGRVLVALAREREVGVDVEAVRILPELERMAEQIFTPFERTIYETLAPGARLSAFFRGWTRKEAALKALGEGFHREPTTIPIGLSPERAGSVWNAIDDSTLERFSFADLEAPQGFAAAVCAEGKDWKPRVLCGWQRGLQL